MPASGTALVDFGAFPGACDASVGVTGQSGITTASLVEAWLIPVATADNTADEHIMPGAPRVIAGAIIDGVGFTVYANASPGVPIARVQVGRGRDNYSPTDRLEPLPTGQWSVAWVWN